MFRQYYKEKKRQNLLVAFILIMLSLFLNHQANNVIFQLFFEESRSNNPNFSYIFFEPIMKLPEKKIFYKYLDNANTFFEFGSGGSTHQAAIRHLNIYSVECGPEWHDLIKRDFIKAKKIEPTFRPKINYLTFDFNTIISPSNEELLGYVDAYKKEYNANLLFINGKFKRNCLINVFKKITNQSIVIVYDVVWEKEFDDLYSIIEKVDKIIVLKKKASENKQFNIQSNLFLKRQSVNGMSLQSYLQEYKEIVDKYKNSEDNYIIPSSSVIWTMWWDGEANAPPIIRLCIDTIRKHFKFGKVMCLSKENYSNYTTIPSYIIDKLNSGKISLTHFSDALRVNLIMNQGGMWLDSTIYCHEDIETAWFKKPFYTVHRENNFPIGGGKWTVFNIAGYKNSITYRFINDFFLAYWKNHDRIAHYFLFDFSFLFGYTYIPIINRYIDDVPLTINYVSEIFYSLNKPYNEEEYDKITNLSFFSKLSYKHPLSLQESGELTMYGYLAKINHFTPKMQ